MNNMICDCPVTKTPPPSEGYEAITFAYDLLCPDEARMLHREVKRLQKKGESLVLHVFDTRGTGKRTYVSAEIETLKESAFAEIWRETE